LRIGLNAKSKEINRTNNLKAKPKAIERSGMEYFNKRPIFNGKKNK